MYIFLRGGIGNFDKITNVHSKFAQNCTNKSSWTETAKLDNAKRNID